MKYILDASAIIAFFRGENGGAVVRKVLFSYPCCIHSVNWIELYYKIHRYDGEEAAEAAMEKLHQMGVCVTDIAGEDFMRRVAKIKITYPALSLGDCHALGLAEWLNGTVITSDKRFSDASTLAKVKQIR